MASAVKQLIFPPSNILFSHLKFPLKTLCGPGPSNMHPDVSKSLSLPLLGHLHPEFLKIMDEVKAGVQYLFQTKADWSLAVSGTGHCAMEAALINLVEPGERALVCTNGIWGERFADLADRHGFQSSCIIKEPGKVFALDEVEKAIIEHSPAVVFVTHGESSSGTLHPLEGLGQMCRKHGSILLVDSVAAAGGVPLLMDQWEIDCIYTGSQKALGSPPGICPIAFSDRARAKIQNRKSRVPSFYLDMNELANYWGCDAGPRRYHHTGPISLVYALHESLRLLAEEGLEASWERHRLASQRLQDGLSAMGLHMLVPDPNHRLPLVNAVQVPPGVDWKGVTGSIMAKHNLEIAGGLGPTAGKIWRIGLMGVNASEITVDRIVSALKEELRDSGSKL